MMRDAEEIKMTNKSAGFPKTPEEAIEDKRWLSAALHTALYALELIELLPETEAKKIALATRKTIAVSCGVNVDDEQDDDTQAASELGDDSTLAA